MEYRVNQPIYEKAAAAVGNQVVDVSEASDFFSTKIDGF